MRRTALICLSIAALLLAPCSQALAAIDLSGMRTIGSLNSVTKSENGVLLDCDDHSQVRVQVLAPDIVRVRVAFQRALGQQDHSWAIAKTEWSQVPTKVTESKDSVSVETSELRVVVNRNPLRRIVDACNHPSTKEQIRGAALCAV
jgi:hypothetical protein